MTNPNMKYVANGEGYYHIGMTEFEYYIRDNRVFTALIHDTLANEGVLNIALTIPEGYGCLFSYSVNTSAETQMQVYKDTVYTGGTDVPARPRNECKTPTVSIPTYNTTATISDAGTLFADVIWGATSPGNQQGSGGLTNDPGFLYPPGATRLFRFTSNAADNNVIVRMDFRMRECSNTSG